MTNEELAVNIIEAFDGHDFTKDGYEDLVKKITNLLNEEL